MPGKPKYPPDDGPLSKKLIDELNQKNAPSGTTTSSLPDYLDTEIHKGAEKRITPSSIPKEKLHVDMDGVLCDIAKGYQWAMAHHPDIVFPQSIPGLFENLDPIEGAIEAINRLRDSFDVWILSAPSVRNPNCYTEKRIWIERHFDYQLAKRLILCTNKGLIKGHYLIDDNINGKGQETFEGRLIHFGSTAFPHWSAVLEYFEC